MNRDITPIASLAAGRPQEMGKVKLGIKKGNRPSSIDTFRFVSTDVAAIGILAGLYGGEVKMVEGKADLVTEANEIDIVLPPDPLGGTPIYELWSGAGCQRRCDGVDTQVMVREGDDVHYETAPCLCVRDGSLSCKPTTRLTMIIPQVRLGGVWQLKTSSWAAAREMTQMVSLIEAAQSRGLVTAKLRTEKRTQQGSKRPFTVPILVLDSTVAELSAGVVPVIAVAGDAPVAALPAPSIVTVEQRDELNRLFSVMKDPQREAVTAWMEVEDIDPKDLTFATAQRVLTFLMNLLDEGF